MLIIASIINSDKIVLVINNYYTNYCRQTIINDIMIVLITNSNDYRINNKK